MKTIIRCAAALVCLAAVPAALAVPVVLGQESIVATQLSSNGAGGLNTTRPPTFLGDDGAVAVAVVFVSRDGPRVARSPRHPGTAPWSAEANPVEVGADATVAGPVAESAARGAAAMRGAGSLKRYPGGTSRRGGSVPATGAGWRHGRGALPGGGGDSGRGPVDRSMPIDDSPTDSGGADPMLRLADWPVVVTSRSPGGPTETQLSLAVVPIGSPPTPRLAALVNNTVPIPSTMLLLVLGLASVVAGRHISGS